MSSLLNKYYKQALIVASVTIAVFLLGYLFYVLSWFEILGLFFMKTILGFKLAGIKSFGKALFKIGGKKVLVYSTGGMLLKRHIIDLSSKFFTEHSIQRYSRSIKRILFIQLDKIKSSTLSKKIQGGLALLLSVPLISFLWTKVLSAVAQKLLYKIFYPVVLMVFTFLKNSFSFIGNLFTLFFQLLFIDFFAGLLKNSKAGKAVLNFFVLLFSLVGRIIAFFNKILVYLGVDIRHYLVVYSISINKWLEDIIYKDLSYRKRLLEGRKLRVPSYVQISQKRAKYKLLRSEKKISIGKMIKNKLFVKEKRVRVSVRDEKYSKRVSSYSVHFMQFSKR